MTLYQIAEATGHADVDDLRDTLSPAKLCEWGVYLNSPFSRRGREAMMNGWLVHVVRSLVADKRNRPKFSDSMFPFDKLAKEFFIPPKSAKRPPSVAPGTKVRTVGEAQHIGQMVAKRYEEWLADYRAGRVPGKGGLYIHERLRK